MSYMVLIIFVICLIFWRKIYDLIRGKGSFDDIYLFNSKLAEMLKLDLPLDGAVEQIVNEAFSPVTYRFSSVNISLQKVLRGIREGKSLGEALENERRVFPRYYVDMIKIGEAEGDLVGALEVLNSYLKVSKEFKVSNNQLAGYFLLMAFVFMGVVAFLSHYILPTFIELFKGMNLQYYTPLTIFVSVITKVVPLLLAIGVFIYTGIFVLRRTKEIRWYIDRIIARLPIARNIIKSYEYMIFCRVMSNLLENYVPVDRALILAAGAADNFIYSEAIKDAVNAVEPTLSASLARSGLFDGTFLFMVSLGEKTERLAETFGEMAEFYSDDYSETLYRTMRLTEVGMTSVIGILAGAFIIGVFSPITRLIVLINNNITY